LAKRKKIYLDVVPCVGLPRFGSVQFRENGEPKPEPTERISEFRFTEVHEPDPGSQRFAITDLAHRFIV
jgi:hypothetical protein